MLSGAATRRSRLRTNLSDRLVGWQVGRLIAAGQRNVGAVLDALDGYDGAAATVGDLVAARSALGSRPAAKREDRWLSAVGGGLTVVNGAAVTVMVIEPDDPTRPLSTTAVSLALVLGLALSIGQLGFAAATSRRLRETRFVDDVVRGRLLRPSTLPLEAVALALLTTLVGWLIHVWVRSRAGADAESYGVLLALTLGLQAWVAPWLTVAVSGRAELDDATAGAVLDRQIRQYDAHRDRSRSTAALTLVAARSAAGRVRHLLAESACRSGQLNPTSWVNALDQLTAATAAAEARFTTVTGGCQTGPTAD